VDTLVTKVRKNVRSHGLIKKGDAVLVAVSGGVDSMVLVEVLRKLAETDGFTIAVAHFNHQLRGRASDLDEKLVQKYCARHELRLEAGRGDVKAVSKDKKISIEMAGRELRLHFLRETARRLKCGEVALAHHADDQVELFFIRLFRGSGGDGLAGMAWRGDFLGAKELKLVRPLLDLEKTRLLEYAKQHQVPYREDATNQDVEILRNRIRKKLIPYVTSQFGGATMSAMSRTMEVVGAEADLVKQEAVGWLGSKRRKSFERLHLAVQRQVIRQQLWVLGVQESFDLVEALRGQAGIWMQVDAGTFLCRQLSGLVERRAPQSAAFHQAERQCELSEALGAARFASLGIIWERSKAPKSFTKPKRVDGLEVFDAEKVGGIITLRHWRAGDRFQPLGMPRSVKLQNWFVNRKVPMERRRQLVVAETADGRVFWVEGERIGEQFKLDKASRQRLKWQWQAVSSP